jgi:hypothetical protein
MDLGILKTNKEEKSIEAVLTAETDINAAHKDAIQSMCRRPSHRRRRKGWT